MTKYVDIIFIQGRDGDPDLGPVTEYGPPTAVDVLYNVEGVVAHGATEESILTAFAYLLQWESDMNPVRDEPSPRGRDDDEWLIRHSFAATFILGLDDEPEDGDYILSAHLGLGHVGLVRLGTNPSND